MTETRENTKPFNVLCVVQGGRLEFEAALFAISFRAANPDFKGRLIMAEPQQGGKWHEDPRIQSPEVRELLEELGVEIRPFTARVFGQAYPNGNKIEALQVLPAGEPFVFFDTDTLHLGPLDTVPFDFDHPAASMKREGTWPEPALYGPGYEETWRALYDQFDIPFDGTEDTRFPAEYWERYLYFNAGWFFGADPVLFGAEYLRIATGIRDTPPPALDCQAIYPWLDQIALPLVVTAMGGGRPTFSGLLDGSITCHWRLMPLLYAREADLVVEVLERVTAPNRYKKVLKLYDPFKRMIFQARGQKVRALFDRNNLPKREQAIRNEIKRNKLWVR